MTQWQAFVEVVRVDVLGGPDPAGADKAPTLYRHNVGDPRDSGTHAVIALLAHLETHQVEAGDTPDELLNLWARCYGDLTDGTPTDTLAANMRIRSSVTVEYGALRIGIDRV